MSTLYLIDGNSYIYRAYYAVRGLTNSKGFPTNAIYGFTNMLLKILREKAPDYIGVVFDTPAPTLRHKLYEKYKAHRPKMPQDLHTQIPYVKEIVNAFRIPALEMEGYEADDIIATLAKKAESENIDVYIITADKDMFQVLSPKIKAYDTMREKITEAKDVIDRFGVEPARIPEVMALIGDASDNIPGVHGIGEKTAKELLKEFGGLDNLIKNYNNIKKPDLKSSISKNIDNIKLSFRLSIIDTDVPVKASIHELKSEEPDWRALLKFFREFEFTSLLKLIPAEKPLEAEYITVLKEGDLNELLSTINSIKQELTLDTETTSKFPMIAELVGISFSITPEKAYYIPITHSYLGVSEQLPKEFVVTRIKDILENPEIKKIGHNIKYDMLVLRNEGIELKGIAFDTIIADYLLNPTKPNHNLEDVSLNYLGVKKLSFDDVFGKGKKDFREVSIEDATKYSGEDCVVTLGLRNTLAPELKKQELDTLFYDMEMPLVGVLADMEITGVRIDLALMDALSKELERELINLEERIYFLAGEEFNINSPKQLRKILFEKLGLRTIKKTKTGFSTDVDVLQELAFEHELPREILEHRTLSKLKGTYVDTLPKMINPKTGRLHTSFNQTVTATGRLSSSDPNLQNIPIRGEWGRRIREAFVAEKGHLIMSSDYSQIELRILAHISQDEGLIDVFIKDGDIHTMTASELFGVPPEDVIPEMRRRAKTVNFGIIYGISPYGLSQELGITPDQAKKYIDTYFQKHRGVKGCIENLIKSAEEKGYVSTIFGRKRSIPELKSSNKNTRLLGERLTINSPIQGSAADIIKLSMINIWKRLKKEGLKTKMLLQVHDELLFEVSEKEKEKAQALIKEEMEKVVRLSVPLKVDIGIGKNWAVHDS